MTLISEMCCLLSFTRRKITQKTPYHIPIHVATEIIIGHRIKNISTSVKITSEQ